MHDKHGRAIAFVCSTDGVVLATLLDELGLEPRLTVGAGTDQLTEPAGALAGFLQRVQETDALLEKNLTVCGPWGRVALFAYGQKTTAGIIVFGATEHMAPAKVHKRLQELSSRNRNLPGVSARGDTEMLALAMHDLRNPITGILAASQYLASDARSLLTGEHLRLLDSISASSRSLLRLVDDLLEMSKLERDGAHLNSQITDVTGLVEQNLTLNRLLARKRGILLTSLVEHNLPALKVDPLRIYQVIDNLINNAIKFSQAGSTIETKVCRQGDMLLLSVRDEGPGIDEQDLAMVFEPFRKSRVRGEGDRGTGLGLAIVKRIVEHHGGQIDVETELGRGSTFTVLLPISGEKGAKAREAGAGPSTP